MNAPVATGFEPKNPKFAERVKDSFMRQPFMALLGATMPVIEPGYCEIHMPFRDDLTQQHGFLHGGALASIADSAAGYAAFSLMPADAAPLTVEYKLNIMRPGQGARVEARAKVIKPGRSLTVIQADVYNIHVAEDGTEREEISVTSLQTLITLAGRSDEKRT